MAAVTISKMVPRVPLLNGDDHRGIYVIYDLVKVTTWQFITSKEAREAFYFQIRLMNIKFRSKVILYSLLLIVHIREACQVARHVNTSSGYT
jgi:hypothetical protein